MSPRYEIVTINGRPYLLRIPSEKLNSANGAMPVMPKPALPTTTTTTTRNNHVEGNAPVDPPPQEEDPELLAQRQQRRAEDIRLIMKLGFAIWLFTQGAEWPKLLIVYTLALLIFLVQSGRLNIGLLRETPPNTTTTTTQATRNTPMQERSSWKQVLGAFVLSMFPVIDHEAAAAMAAADEAAAREEEERGFVL